MHLKSETRASLSRVGATRLQAGQQLAGWDIGGQVNGISANVSIVLRHHPCPATSRRSESCLQLSASLDIGALFGQTLCLVATLDTIMAACFRCSLPHFCGPSPLV